MKTVHEWLKEKLRYDKEIRQLIFLGDFGLPWYDCPDGEP